jgi:hypothetical protein
MNHGHKKFGGPMAYHLTGIKLKCNVMLRSAIEAFKETFFTSYFMKRDIKKKLMVATNHKEYDLFKRNIYAITAVFLWQKYNLTNGEYILWQKKNPIIVNDLMSSRNLFIHLQSMIAPENAQNLARLFLSTWMENIGPMKREERYEVLKSYLGDVETEIKEEIAKSKKGSIEFKYFNMHYNSFMMLKNQNLDADERRSTDNVARQILKRFLVDNTPFCLFLRRFTLDRPRHVIEAGEKSFFGSEIPTIVTELEAAADPFNRCATEQNVAAKIIANKMSVVGIADDVDWDKIDHYPKLRLRNEEWLDVVTWLICLANRIIVFVDDVSEDLKLEIEVIKGLSRDNDALIINIQKDTENYQRTGSVELFEQRVMWPNNPEEQEKLLLNFIS